MPDHVYRLAARLLESLGAPPPIVSDLHSALEGRIAAQWLAREFFGSRELPLYDLGRSSVVLSFGANLLENWMSPVAQSVGYGEMRQGGTGGRGLLLHIQPRRSAPPRSS